MLGGRASSILKHFDLFSFVGGGPVSKSRCKMFKYFHKGFQYLNFFGGTSQKKHPVVCPHFEIWSLSYRLPGPISLSWPVLLSTPNRSK